MRVAIAIALCCGACAADSGRHIDSAETRINEQLASTVLQELYGRAKVEWLDRVYADDFVDDSPGGGAGKEVIRAAVTSFHQAAPDLSIEVQDVFSHQDKVVLRYVARGTQTGAYGGLPATGIKFAVRGMTVFQIVDRKIRREWTEYDRLGLLKQLGAIP